MTQLHAFGPGLWHATTDAKLGRLDTPVRVVIARLPEGLWVHSPIPAGPALFAEVRSLGPVAYLLSPNRAHHLFLRSWQEQFPEARVLRPDDLVAGASFAGMRAKTIAGAPKFDETVFLHEPSRTLIVTDLFLHVHEHPRWLTRMAFRMLGAYRRPQQGVFWRLRTTDRAAARASLEEVLGWDFDRVLMAHGEPLTERPKEVMRRACAWMLRA